jgi:phosphoglycerol transferase MdoB-like AlkP superfamily enzyme
MSSSEALTVASPPRSAGAGARFGLPPLAGAVLSVVALQLAVYTLLRGAFFAAFRDGAGEIGAPDVAHAFWLGLRFDLRLAILVALPLFALGALPPLHPRRRLGALLWRAWIVAAGLIITLVYAFDFGHYDYLHERLDAKVLDELRSPRESFGMLWESYSVPLALLGVAAAVAGWWWTAGAGVRRARRPAPAGAPGRRRRVAARVGCSIALVLAIYGNLSWYPLRWSQAYFGTSPFVSALASNPVLYFYETLSNKSRQPDPAAVAASYDRLADLLGVERRDRDALAFARTLKPHEPSPFRPNLIVIHMESWAAFQTGMLGNPLPSSPNADALAASSLLFTRAFVPSGPTARSVFSILTGIPDVAENNPRSSASRDPGSVRQPCIVNALEGYEKHYFLGGSANWANIRALIAGNVPDVEIHEEGSYDRERVDVWGVSDLALLEQAVDTLDRAEGPFFAFVQTSGNHKPYTIPDRTEGFEPSDLDAETLRAAGFKSREAYDGFRFLDHALGRFLALARERPWYRDTVIALYGDHGVPAVNGLPFEQIGLVRHHVPLIVHAPRLIPTGRRVEDPVSSCDLLPTCLALMGVPFETTSLGRDVLRPRSPEQRFAFLSNGLVEEDWFYRHERDGRTALYRYASDEPEKDWSAIETARFGRMGATHDALREWALWCQHEGARLRALARASQ